MRSYRRIVSIGFLLLIGCETPSSQAHPDEAAAVIVIRKIGGQVEYNSERRVIKVYLHQTAVKDEDLAALEQLPKLENLYLGKTQIGDAGLIHLNNLAELKTLSLNATNVTDAGLKSLNGLRKLKTLNLQETKATAAGAAQLRQSLPELTVAR